MLRKKRREKDGHKDPLLVEVNRLQENIMKEITQLKMSFDAAEKKQSELDKVAQILGINIFEKSRKLSSENKDSSEKNKSENAKPQERTSSSIKVAFYVSISIYIDWCMWLVCLVLLPLDPISSYNGLKELEVHTCSYLYLLDLQRKLSFWTDVLFWKMLVAHTRVSCNQNARSITKLILGYLED